MFNIYVSKKPLLHAPYCTLHGSSSSHRSFSYYDQLFTVWSVSPGIHVTCSCISTWYVGRYGEELNYSVNSGVLVNDHHEVVHGVWDSFGQARIQTTRSDFFSSIFFVR